MQTTSKSYSFINFFCSSIDCNVFVNMFLVKFSIIIVGQFVSVFWRMGFKIKMK